MNLRKILVLLPSKLSKQLPVQSQQQNTRKKCEICSKLPIKTPKRRQWRGSGVFIVNFNHTSHFFSAVSFVTLNR